jgi:hypothetical protein
MADPTRNRLRTMLGELLYHISNATKTVVRELEAHGQREGSD